MLLLGYALKKKEKSITTLARQRKNRESWGGGGGRGLNLRWGRVALERSHGLLKDHLFVLFIL